MRWFDRTDDLMDSSTAVMKLTAVRAEIALNSGARRNPQQGSRHQCHPPDSRPLARDGAPAANIRSSSCAPLHGKAQPRSETPAAAGRSHRSTAPLRLTANAPLGKEMQRSSALCAHERRPGSTQAPSPARPPARRLSGVEACVGSSNQSGSGLAMHPGCMKMTLMSFTACP